MKDVLKDRFEKVVTASYEVTDPTIDSQAITLQSSGADVLITAATPKFAAQIIRKVADMNWRPLHLLTNVSTSVGAVMEPAGVERGIGVISSAYLKDPTDPQWKNDAGLQHWRDIMKRYLPDADISELVLRVWLCCDDDDDPYLACLRHRFFPSEPNAPGD